MPMIKKHSKRELQVHKVRVVTLDSPTSRMMTSSTDEMTVRMMDALNGMRLNMLATLDRKDYTTVGEGSSKGL
jgi:hypothetical protein